VSDALIRDGKIRRPFLGITPKTLDHRTAQRLQLAEGGVLVQNIIRNSPAHRAGLMPGDVLLTWAGQPVPGRTELVDKVQATTIGSEVEATVLRQGKQYRANVTVQERPAVVRVKGVL
jgi:S1-C subfamily serine protease